MKTTEIVFESGDIVQYRRQDMTQDQVDTLLRLAKNGFVEPFRVLGVRSYEEDDRVGRGHSQELSIIVLKDPQKTKKLSGWWFEKICGPVEF